MLSRLRRVGLPIALAAVVLIAGCGSDDDGGTRPPATATATVAPSATAVATATRTATASATAVPPTASVTPTDRVPPTGSATPTDTAVPTATPTPLPTDTASPTASATPVPNLFLSDRVLNIAHRGGRELAPEATLEAFRSAVALGVDVLEMDLRGTVDGGVVVIHDQTVDRTTDGSGRVDELTLAQIRALDAGHDFTTDGGATYPFRGMGVQVPTFDEVLAEFGAQYMLVEIKIEGPSIVDKVVASLDAFAMRERVVIASFDSAIIAQFRAAAPDVLTAFSLPEAVEFYGLTAELEATYTPPAEFLQVPPTFSGIEVLTPDFLARAERFGLRIHVWDVLGAAQMNAILDLGVAGLIVDEPMLLKEVLAARGLAR